MFKQIKLIKFIKKNRELGLPHFSILTNSDTIIICAKDKEKGINEQLRIPYK